MTAPQYQDAFTQGDASLQVYNVTHPNIALSVQVGIERRPSALVAPPDKHSVRIRPNRKAAKGRERGLCGRNDWQPTELVLEA